MRDYGMYWAIVLLSSVRHVADFQVAKVNQQMCSRIDGETQQRTTLQSLSALLWSLHSRFS